MKRFVTGLSTSAMAIGLVCVARGYASQESQSAQPTLLLRSVEVSKDLISVDVYVDRAADLRTFQLQLTASGGQRGELVLDRITVDKERSDFVFGKDFVIDAVDMAGGRTGALRFDGGVKVEKEAYLATFHFRATDGAKGTFQIDVQEGDDSFLLDSQNEKVDYQLGDVLSVTLSGAKTPVRRSDSTR